MEENTGNKSTKAKVINPNSEQIDSRGPPKRLLGTSILGGNKNITRNHNVAEIKQGDLKPPKQPQTVQQWKTVQQSVGKGLSTQEVPFMKSVLPVTSLFSTIKSGVQTSVTAAVKAGQDTRIRFSLEPTGGDPGYIQWKDAMKMVARLPEGVPSDFRKKLWLTLSEKHLASRGVDWKKAEKFCFNEWSNPDDDELGLQIVRDLHRTGCSLFCGVDAEANQLMLKRVLLAYARWNKAIGYCQGFNMLAAIILEVMEKSEPDALKVMIFMIEGVMPEGYFNNNMRGLSVDMAVFRDLLKLRLPRLSKHLDNLQVAEPGSKGTSYEPPLTNVFTMQWFLTIFSTCLPRDTVLRVWDLILLEGNEILLRTALAVWKGLEERIIQAADTADEFYCVMGQLSQEMLNYKISESNKLIKTLVDIAPFPFDEVGELREKYTYNIAPWSQGIAVAKKGLRILYSDDEDNMDEDEESIAVAASFGMSAVFKSPSGKSSQKSGSVPNKSSQQPNPTGQQIPFRGSNAGPSQQNVDKERLTVDISAMKQQYNKLRQRQKQAHIILTSAMNNQMPIKEGVGANNGYRQQVGNNYASSNPSTAMNHLLVGKKPLVNAKPRRGPHPGAIPPEVRKSSNNTVSRSSVTKKSSDALFALEILDHIPCVEDAETSSVKNDNGDKRGSTSESFVSINDTKKTAAMSVTQVACPQPIVVEPSELKDKQEPYKKSSRKSRRSSSSTSSSKMESFSKNSQDPISSRPTNNSCKQAEERLTQKEKLAKGDVRDEPENTEGNNVPNKKGNEDVSIKAMTSSSSTESGCDGSVDNNTGDDSSEDEALGNVIFDHSVNVHNSHIIVLEKNHDLEDNSEDSKISSANNAIESSNNNHSMATNANHQETNNSAKENTPSTEVRGNENQKTKTNLLMDSIETRTRNVEGDNKSFIDDILKEFDNPESIYIPNKDNNKNENESLNSKSKPSAVSEQSSLSTRRTSGALASQIIKENSEMLEKIMRKRVNSMAGPSVENQVSLEQEELDVIDNGKKKNDENPKEIVSTRNMSKPESSAETQIPQHLPRNSDTSSKKDTGKSKNFSNHYPTVSAMEPVKPQLSKPQLNTGGGMVVQQRSDGRLGGQNSTKPITFNPFPNSSRIGQRKSNEVGRKLGLYPSNK